MKNNLKLFLLTLIGLVGCEKEVELNIDENDSKVVLNAWLKTGHYPQVEINRSTFIFDKRGTDKIENAEVRLFENGEEIGFLEHFESGFYRNESLNIKANAEYTMKAKVEGFEEVSATERSSDYFEEDHYEFKYKAETAINSYGSQSEIEFIFNDKASSTDFYLFRLKLRSKQWNPEDPADTIVTEYFEYLESSDPQIEFVYVPKLGSIPIMTDELFNGNEYTVRFKTNNLKENTFLDEEYGLLDEYLFEVHKINKSFYLYLKSLEYNQYPDPFTEPTQIFSNVKQGYGILATSAIAEFVIRTTSEDDLNE